MHALRGDVFLARAAFENAVRAARDANDSQALAPALHRPRPDDRVRRPGPGRRAVRPGDGARPGRRAVTILLGAARVALSLGDREAAERHAREAIEVSRARRDDPGMAASLELAALTALDPDEALALVDEAAAHLGAARPRRTATPATGSSSPGSPAATEGRDAAVEAERIFRSMGARGPAADAAEIVEAITDRRAADAPDPVAGALPARPRRARPSRRRRGSRRRRATC